jgi:signal transduction histidine kinase
MSIDVIVMFGSLLVLLLCLLIILFVMEFRRRQINYNKEKELMNAHFEQTLLRSQIEVQEATFSTLGKELHDNIGQLLSTAKMMLSITQQQVADAPAALHSAYDTVGKALIEVRSLSKMLNKEWLQQFNLIDNLLAEATHINASGIVGVHLSSGHPMSLTTDKQIILFRIIQEAIQNAIKHASAKNIYIKIDTQNDFHTITVKDDGVGFDITVKSEGVGILNMKQRVTMLGGTIEWQTSDEGCSVVIHVPV